MAKHRKFNAERFFKAFVGHEEELRALFCKHHLKTPSPQSIEDAQRIVLERTGRNIDSLIATLYDLNDLATRKGRDMIEAATATFQVRGLPGQDVPIQRVACWLYQENPEAFEHAAHLLGVRSSRGNHIALFPGSSAKDILDVGQASKKFEVELNQRLSAEENTERLEVRHHVDGPSVVFSVFCERHAEVQLEFAERKRSVQSTVRRPVKQDLLFYHQETGILEIQGGRIKHRELLRSAFAQGVFGDDTFFPREELSRVLNLSALTSSGFSLPVSSGHSARITGIRLSGHHSLNGFSTEFKGARLDVIEILRSQGS